MIDYLIGFSLLCLIYATRKNHIWNREQRDHLFDYCIRTKIDLQKYQDKSIGRIENHIKGSYDKTYIAAKIAEKTADRAFNLASSANLGVVALQKSLMVPRMLTKHQTDRNILAKEQVQDLFEGQDDMFNWLRPVLGEEENAILDKVLEDKQKKEYNGTN